MKMKKLYGLFATGLMLTAIVAVRPIRAYWTQKTLAPDGVTVLNAKWDSSLFPANWQMYPTQGSNFTGSQTQAAVLTSAFGAWTNAVGTVSATRGADVAATAPAPVPAFDGANVITTVPPVGALPTGVLAYTYPYVFDTPGVDQLGRTIKFAGEIMEADMAFSSAYPFSLNATPGPNAVDFQGVATHECGHFFGMDHATNTSSTMFWTTAMGFTYQRTPSMDDIAGMSTLYPPATFSQMGTLSGTVKTTSSTPVFGAIVVAVNTSGQPVASTLSDPSGAYTIQGLPAGQYFVYAEPLSGRISATNIVTLPTTYPSATVNTAFTTRYH